MTVHFSAFKTEDNFRCVTVLVLIYLTLHQIPVTRKACLINMNFF